jgi:hypothetical protein
MSLYKPKKGEKSRNLTLFSTFLPFLAYISSFKSKKFYAGFLMGGKLLQVAIRRHQVLASSCVLSHRRGSHPHITDIQGKGESCVAA